MPFLTQILPPVDNINHKRGCINGHRCRGLATHALPVLDQISNGFPAGNGDRCYI